MILLIDAVRTIISSDEQYTPETRGLNKELADYLATRKTMVIIVTNAFGENYKKIRSLLADYSFETFTLEKNPPKTDPEYFAHFLAYYGMRAEDCFYLDYRQDNLDAAAECGIAGALFTSTAEAIEVLKTME